MVKKIDKVYSEYQNKTNMSCSELKRWSKNPCSNSASLNREPLNRNIRLKCKRRIEWTSKDVTDAKKTISFNSRMIKNKCGKSRKYKGKNCGCGRDVSLKNWALDPSKR